MRYVIVFAVGVSLTSFSHVSASIKTNLISGFLLSCTCITLMVKLIYRPTAVLKIHDSMCSELKHYIEKIQVQVQIRFYSLLVNKSED